MILTLGTPANETTMKFTYLSPGLNTESMETPYVINVDAIQANVHINKRIDNERLLRMSKHVPLLSTITFSFLHFIAMMVRVL